MSDGMDPRGRGIIDLNDKQHPNYALTGQNSSSKFLSIAREVRLMIYEYAVYIKEEIQPLQLKSRSNQFKLQTFVRDRAYTSREPQPTAASLTRVCRTIYAELEHFQPFYKVHTFLFMDLDTLHTYIAAITPSRRRAIRRITYEPYDWFGGHYLASDGLFEGDRRCPVHKGTLIMLSQTGLEEFTLVKTMTDEELPPGRSVVDQLRNELKNMKKYPDNLPTIWNLPCFRLRFELESPDERTDEMIKQIDETWEARRQRIATDKPEWFKQLDNSRSVENAMRELSGLDIMGEDRVTLDRAASSLGPVSSRTRNKCRPPNSIGQIVESIPRYSADGILTDRICQVHDIRWDGTDVQCQVSLSSNPKDEVWEDISTLLVAESIWAIFRFYNNIMKEHDSSRLDDFKNKPTLRDIIEIQRGFHFLQDTKEEIPQYLTRREYIPHRSKMSILRGTWIYCTDKWETYIAKLEREKSSAGREGSDSEAPRNA
ncbi:hypothetical protein F4811DRAFT_562301 [Daldinia bambusicola]|nr:hypothetical protein F4811DRAFT_562301 [Daldinia bambusicola]